MKKIEEFMNKDVVYLRPDDSVFDAAKIFSELRISGAPVVDGGEIIGVITESDIIKFMDVKISDLPGVGGASLANLILAIIGLQKLRVDFKKELEFVASSKVSEVMSKNPITITADKTILDVASVMQDNDINRLPVVSEGKLVGIVARADIIKALVE